MIPYIVFLSRLSDYYVGHIVSTRCMQLLINAIQQLLVAPDDSLVLFVS